MKKRKTAKPKRLGSSYSSENCFDIYRDNECFSLRPKALPRKKIILHVVLFLAFGSAFTAFLHHKGEHTAITIVPIGFCILLSMVYCVLIYVSYSREQKRGELLHYDIEQGELSLPRLGITQPASDVFLEVTTFSFGNSQVTELHLVLQEDHQKRWLVLTSLCSFKNAFDHVLNEMRETVPIEIKK